MYFSLDNMGQKPLGIFMLLLEAWREEASAKMNLAAWSLALLKDTVVKQIQNCQVQRHHMTQTLEFCW